LKQVAIRSFRFFTSFAKRLKHDPILARILYAENTILMQNGEFKILNDCDDLEFFKVQAKQTSSLQINLKTGQGCKTNSIKPQAAHETEEAVSAVYSQGVN